MKGDVLIIKDYHHKAAGEIFSRIEKDVIKSLKYVISIAGESGSGKSETAAALGQVFGKNSISSVIIGQDDYFFLPPKSNAAKRREDIAHVGVSEVNIALLDDHVEAFHQGADFIAKPLVFFDEDRIEEEQLNLADIKVLIIEGTYTTLIDKTDCRIFIDRDYRDTLASRKERNREQQDSFLENVLLIEHQIISKHRELADIIIAKDFSINSDTGECMQEITKICMLSTHGYFDPVPVLGQTDTGGQVVYVLELAKAIARQGKKVDIYTRWFDKSKPQIEEVKGLPSVRVVRIHCGPWEFVPKEFIYDYLPELVDNMVTFIKENNLDYDLYHGHYVDAGVVAVQVAKVFSKPVYFTPHSLGAWKREQMGGDPEQMEKDFNFNHRIGEENRIINTVNALSVTSEVQRERLKNHYQYEAPNIITIPPGVDIYRYNPEISENSEFSAGLPAKYIYCLSRIDSNKGHDLLLHAFDIVRKNDDDVILIIGGGSPDPKPRELEVRSKMMRIIEEKGMQDRVRIIGYVPDERMKTYYRKAKIFVLPSLFEPFGMTSQEAMACGTPVIASRFGGIRNYINHGENGWLVDPTDTGSFAAAILELLGNDELLRKMSIEARSLAVNEFSWQAIAEKFCSFYLDFYS